MAGAILPPGDGGELMRLAAIAAGSNDSNEIERRLEAAVSESFLNRPLLYVDGWAVSELDLDILRAIAAETERGVH
jgi:hypothetical protein